MNTRKTKIVCTIGPASSSRKTIRSLIRNGMDVARLNFSHGDHVTYKKITGLIRAESGNLKKTVSILQDLQGIKIRVGLVSNGSVELKKGAEIFLHSGKDVSNDKHIFISYPALRKDIKIGDRILFDDGLIQANVTGKTRDGLRVKIVEGGILRNKKGVNLPHVKTTLPSFTDKDKNDLSFGLTIGVDYAALSFVRSASDVRVVKEWLKKRHASLPLIAKIEKPEAIDDIDSILDEADGIMIARGDLGVEIATEEVPIIQKMLISKANEKGKLVITATQMLESMTEHSRPTRAEATDVANAVIDGSDALMLSAETATGKYPVNVVKMMDRIIRYTESQSLRRRDYSGFAMLFSDFSGAVAEAACTAAGDIHAKAIVAFTQSGFTARLVSKFRPEVPIIGVTPHADVKRIMSLYWGVTPMIISHVSNTDDMIQEVEKLLIGSNIARKGDNIVITAGSPLMKRGTTNLIKLHKIS
ncbi:MAG: pyruvate kinase [Thermodesulfovibrionales bacterium]|nr:pyruvate kinase [Thermodesulfovibrionales bacterium]